MEPIEFGKFIVQFITWFWDRFVFFTECNQGQAVIKKRLGYPIKWRTKPRIYWKCLFIDMFDKVDMRIMYAQFNAHSFYFKEQKNDTIIPYNILIDFQVEYQIINPLVIYEASGYMDGEDVVLSYVNNTVHSVLAKLIKDKNEELSYNDILTYLDETVKTLRIERISRKNEVKFDDKFLKQDRGGIDLKDCISINEIVITSFDKNISLRTTI